MDINNRLPNINKEIIFLNEIEQLKLENYKLKQKNNELKEKIKYLLEELSLMSEKKRKYNKRNASVKINKKEYEKFRKGVLKRDNYTCQKCGSTERLQVHHIKSRKKYPELIMDVNNCITLCIVCHSKTDSFFVS